MHRRPPRSGVGDAGDRADIMKKQVSFAAGQIWVPLVTVGTTKPKRIQHIGEKGGLYVISEPGLISGNKVYHTSARRFQEWIEQNGAVLRTRSPIQETISPFESRLKDIGQDAAAALW